jgi:hypothetical protein
VAASASIANNYADNEYGIRIDFGNAPPPKEEVNRG